jgi:hypothetical protein
LIAFWCIDPKETNAFGVSFEGIAIDDANLCDRTCSGKAEQCQHSDGADSHGFRAHRDRSSLVTQRSSAKGRQH